MSPELETLDQLLGGELPLAVIRSLYPDVDSFKRGVLALLTSGDVCLLRTDRTNVPAWGWREMFLNGSNMEELGDLKLKITQQGARRIA
jgi:hypothetical protein